MKTVLKGIPATLLVIAIFLPGSAMSYTTADTPVKHPSNNSATAPKAAEKNDMSPKANVSKATNKAATQKPGTNEMKDPKK